MTPVLPDDVARCDGMTRGECVKCWRRVAPRPEIVVMICGPSLVSGFCEFLIDGKEKGHVV
jgi:hypothetical protein